MKPSLKYILKDKVHRAIIACILRKEEATFMDIIDCLITKFYPSINVPAPTSLRKRLATLEKVGVLERRVAVGMARKYVWSVKKNLYNEPLIKRLKAMW